MSRMLLDDGLDIAYDVAGQGPPLVFLHCWAGNRSFYVNQIAKFHDRYTCVSFDFPGHGETPAFGDPSVANFGEVAVKVLEKLGISDAAFVGHSLGGMVAQYLALEHPGMVDALVLVDTTSYLSGWFTQRWAARVAVVLGEVSYRLWRNGWRVTKGAIAGTAACHPLSRMQPRVFTAIECSKVDNYTMAKLLNDARQFNVTDRLSEIASPALIICGDADMLADVGHSMRMHKRIPDNTMKLIIGAGHMTIFEKPHEVNAVMDSFLAEYYPPVAKQRRAGRSKVKKS